MIYRAKIEAEIYYDTDTKDIGEVQEEILDEVSCGLGLADLAGWDVINIDEIALVRLSDNRKE